MPSQLVGLNRTLAWTDFKGTPPADTGFAAATYAKFTVMTTPAPGKAPQTNPVFQKSGSGYKILDAITVTAIFDSKQSWKIPLIPSSDAQKDQNILDHEQGHYNINALIARDLFVQLMLDKNTVYPTQQDGVNNYWSSVNLYQNQWNSLFPSSGLYDDQTGHSLAGVFIPSTNIFTPPQSFQKGPPQKKWEGLIAQAFTTPRPGGGTLPDGTPLMMTLQDVLKNGGVYQTP
jgi:hypothetical protein